MTDNKRYCADLQGGLWLQYQSRTNTWLAKPCCLFKKTYEIKQDLTKEFWDFPEIQEIRQQNLQGSELPTACSTCVTTEKNGNYSRRMSWNDRLGTGWQLTNSVLELDLQIDFACNLACRICGPELSTQWRLVDPDIDPKLFKVRPDNQKIMELLKTLPMQHIKQIHFQGGEPLLNRTHRQILESLKKQTDISEITVWYHTNGTSTVDSDMIDFWKEFKRVEVYFSIDDLGSRMEYQRWPVRWIDLEKNLLWWKENLPHNSGLYVERTIGILNAAWVTEFDQWAAKNFSETRWQDPISINYHTCYGEYSLRSVTNEYKDHVLQSIPEDHWVHKTFQSLKAESPIDIERMINHLNKHDCARGQSWQSVYPEFQQWYSRYIK